MVGCGSFHIETQVCKCIAGTAINLGILLADVGTAGERCCPRCLNNAASPQILAAKSRQYLAYSWLFMISSGRVMFRYCRSQADTRNPLHFADRCCCTQHAVCGLLGNRRPLFGGFLQAFIVCAAGLSTLYISLESATAQETLRGGGEAVHLGTIQVRPFRGDDSRNRSEVIREQAEAAENLYLRGLKKLRDGDRARAQQLFERLVARYPDAPQATHARRELSHLYADLRIEPKHEVNSTGDFPVAGTKRPLEEPIGRARSGPSVPVFGEVRGVELVRLRSRVSEVLSDDLRLAVGDRVFFSPNSDALGAKARRVLRAQAKWLRGHRHVGVLIEGHADEPGNTEQNHKMSVRRAAAVRDRLIAEGVSGDRLHIAAVGRTEPVAQCNSRACSAQNRRVVILVLRGNNVGQRNGRRRFSNDQRRRDFGDDSEQVMWLIGPGQYRDE